MRRLLLAFVLLFPASAAAENRAVLAIQAKVCRDGTSCVIARGSCVAVGRNERGNLLLLTAAHVVRGTRDARVYVGDEWRQARVLIITPDRPEEDLALVEVYYSEPWPCVQLVRDVLGLERTEVVVAGYSEGYRWTHKRGLFGVHTDRWVTWTNAVPDQGQSGGAVLVGGRLVGIITGYETDGSREGIGPSAAAVRLFLDTCHRRGITIVYPSSPTPSAQTPPIVTQPNPNPAPPADANALYLAKQEIEQLKAQLAVLDARDIELKIKDPNAREWRVRIKPKVERNEVTIVGPNATAGNSANYSPGVPVGLEMPRVEVK